MQKPLFREVDLVYFEISSSGMKSCDLDRTLSYPINISSLSFSRLFAALVMTEKYFFSLAIILLFEVVLVTASYFTTCVEGLYSYMNTIEHRSESVSSFLVIKD